MIGSPKSEQRNGSTVEWEPMAHPKITENVFARAFPGFAARFVFVDEVGSNARTAKLVLVISDTDAPNFLLSFTIRNTPAHPP